MAVELHFTKTDNTPWGFRLTGGSDYEVPLTVIKVTEGSIAENAGMQVGDVIVQINDIPTAGLTHTQAHDSILLGGNDFVLAVKRGDLSTLPPRLLLVETSVENDLKSEENTIEQKVEYVEESKDADLNITDEEIVKIIGESSQVEKVVESTTIKQSEVIQAINVEESEKLSQERKWSTFLQKPKNPKPKPVQTEPEGPKAPPYRVIIKKQPKKSLEASQQILNEATKAAIDETIQSNEEPKVEELQPELDENENLTESDAKEPDEEKGEELEDENKIDDDEDSFVQVDCSPPESRRPSETERKVSYSLEEQLAQVQKQLLALSQLPSAIQETLNAVTQQLSQIVAIKEQEEIIEARVTVKEEITEEIIEGEGVTLEGYEENALSTLAEEESYEIEAEGRNTASMRDDTDDEQALYEMLERECEKDIASDEAILENEEALREEQERNEKKEKELMEEYRLTQPDQRPSHPLTPLQRPIILPGGRKWAQPDDAVSKIRRPSMTDEKIANTINTYSEVIVGHTMGINFLKYQPPPKNLDHLQRSAVYKLVHDIEPPVRGIIARETKVLAEQDYYRDQQEMKLPPQMER